ncbi:hypothetical protein GCM10022226_72060 [Sphaerisporangium flaviroseum]|uniref:DUF4180 domain-containing protein n=1 Tax=Sphaerisporangium flaviroseum TaxID=509199 RepID=A0ABP7JBA6_9ACTN
MADRLQRVNGTAVLICAPDGAKLSGERDALDIIGEAGYQGADWVAIPVSRFDDDFFRLRTRIAGEIIQKFANYRLGVAVVGDISRHTAAGSALRDFVREANQGTQVWFVSTLEDLYDRLGGGRRAGSGPGVD